MSSTMSKRSRKVHKLRVLAWGLFAATLVVLAIFSALQIWKFSNILDQALYNDASDDLELIMFHYEDKFNVMDGTLVELAQHAAVIGVLENSSDAQSLNNSDQFMKLHVKNSWLTYATLVNATGHIVVSGNADRSGKYWDPAGVVSEVLSNCSAGSYMTTAPISVDEIEAEGADDIEEGSWSYSARQGLEDVGEETAMVRFVARPVFSKLNTSKCVGVVVFGDVLNGNMQILEDTLGAFGSGFAEIVLRSNGTFHPAVHALYQNGDELNFNWKLSESQLSMIASTVLSDSFTEDDLYVGTITNEWGSYIVAVQRTEPGERGGDGGPEAGGRTYGMVIRGIEADQNSSTLFEFEMVLCAFVLGFVIFDMLGTLFSVSRFIDPLDKLVVLVKKNRSDEYDKLLERIMNVNMFVLQVGICILFAISFLIAQVAVSRNQLELVIGDLVGVGEQLRGMQYVYVSKMKQMSQSSLTLAYTDSYRRTVQGTEQPGDISDVVSSLREVMIARKIEFATLVNRDSKIIACANNNRTGEIWDPSGVVNKTLELNTRIIVSVAMEWDDFMKEGSMRWL
eukprot:TRINITY_DN2267_c0_g1_i5.p1 TRINITY_DN2267_c0_g1~~TRINITY_DN2267_c0_g1_i5.p1  ORF type:complete len:602 (-),score=163.50 TRINITY_DN2267_c0_g1_i5:899-2599(-)